ncbi:alpha/beta hydrolase [Salinisphaera hydrothermalis]|uniref:alpha/beta hydrolase n=1 Tax=Salinisphaera hydrothermalis TaxID=563188 RepID=UPI00334079C0
MTACLLARRCRRFAWALLLIATGAVAAASPRIHWMSCPAGADAGRSAAVMRCGEFMPGDHLGSRPVRLRITRLQARPDRATPHPVVYVPGGPGDAGGQHASALRAWRIFQQTAGWPRDLVIFDPRGTGMSTPRPRCSELGGPASADALGRCFKRLGPVTAASLGARAQVADLHRLIDTLNQGSVVIWAESYGALLARRLAATHPNDVQLLILDSPVLQPLPARRRQALAYRRRRQQLLQDCRRRLGCRLSVPSLAVAIDGLIASRHRHPSMITTAEPPRRAKTVRIDGAAVRAMIILSAYDERDDVRVIHALRHAVYEPAALSALVEPLVALDQRRGGRAPVYWSTRCSFRPVSKTAGTPAAINDPCRQWPVPRLEAVASRIDIPTLVIAGARDVLTSPLSAGRAVLRHPGWQFLPVAGGGHGVLAHDHCAQRAVARFIARDGAWLGAGSCPARANGP